jgi:Lhr-like helicase
MAIMDFQTTPKQTNKQKQTKKTPHILYTTENQYLFLEMKI